MSDENFGMSTDVGELAKALSAAQAEMRHALKSAENPHFRSRYADLAGIIDACREPLAKHGLAFTQLAGYSQGGASVRTVLMHTSGQYIWSLLVVPVNKQDAQGVGSALTYARRYGLSAIVGIAQDDDDGNGAGQDDGRRSQPKAKVGPKPSPVAERVSEIVRALEAAKAPGSVWDILSGFSTESLPREAGEAVSAYAFSLEAFLDGNAPDMETANKLRKRAGLEPLA